MTEHSTSSLALATPQSKSIYKAELPSLLHTLTGLLLFLLLGAVQALYGPTLKGLSQSLQVPLHTVTFLVSVHGAGALLGVLTLGSLVHPLTRYRIPFALGLLVGGLVLLSLGGWILALLGALLVGFGFGVLAVRTNTFFATRYAERSPSMVNLGNATFGIGAVLSPLLAGVLNDTPHLPYLLMAVAGGLLIPLARSLQEGASVAAVSEAPRSASSKTLLWMFLVLTAVGTGLESSSAFFPTHFQSTGLSAAQAATFTSGFFLVFTLGRLLGVPLSARLSPFVLMGCSLLLNVLLLLFPSPWMLVLSGAGVALFFPNLLNWMMQSLPGAAQLTSHVVAAAMVGGTLMPALVSRWLAHAGDDRLPQVLLVITFLTLLGILGLQLGLKRTPSKSH